MRAIDLYSGIGGWTIGLDMAGINVVRCYEWWDKALDTYNKNLHAVAVPQDIRALEPTLIDVGNIDIVVGSPPCTQFSYSNRGGSGDIVDGLKDIAKFLEVVEYLKPKYWAMENVPRVKKVLEIELAPGGQLEQHADLVSVLEVVDVSEFGVPQRRRRMIAGDFPFGLLESYREATPEITLGHVLEELHARNPRDPIYDLEFGENELTDMANEEPLDGEETRMNREAKRFHPVYNKMPFPDPVDRPARTVTALCTRVSRESIVIADPDDPGEYRRLNVRERASLQGFPANYQLQGRSHAEKIKLVGNAIPPPLTYLIAHAMQGTSPDSVAPLSSIAPRLESTVDDVIPTVPTTQGRTYQSNRSFRAALPNLRFGSGMRFELANQTRSTWVDWEVRFFFGSSKDIRSIPLHVDFWDRLQRTGFFAELSEPIGRGVDTLVDLIGESTPIDIQRVWSRRSSGISPFDIVDSLGDWSIEIREGLREVPEEDIETFIANVCGYEIEGSRKNGLGKLLDNSIEITAGLICGTWFNVEGPLRSPTAVGQPVQMEGPF